MTVTTETKVAEIKAKIAGVDAETLDTLNEIDLKVRTGYTLADAIREGCDSTEQSKGWGDGVTNACALTSGLMAARARSYV